MPNSFISSNDDFEQFDALSSKNSTPTKKESSLLDEPVRTRKNFSAPVSSPVALSETELLLKINQRAINYLAKREFSRFELQKKLNSDAQDFKLTDGSTSTIDELINHVLNDLARHNWQSDQRYAEQISKVKGALFGVARLKQEFKQRGLSDELAKKELDELKNTELARATEIWQRKFGQHPVGLKEQAKQSRFMASRGFSFDIVRKIIKEIDSEKE